MLGDDITVKSEWELIKRDKILDTPYLKVYNDEVRLPNGNIISDFSLTKKADVVIIVATDKKKRVIVVEEYKHGAGEVQLTVPGGIIDEGETDIDAAKRELREETGFEGKNFRRLGVIYEDPSKEMRKISVFRAEEVEKSSEQNLDYSETIVKVSLFSIDEINKQVKRGLWKASSSIASLSLAGLLNQ